MDKIKKAKFKKINELIISSFFKILYCFFESLKGENMFNLNVCIFYLKTERFHSAARAIMTLDAPLRSQKSLIPCKNILITCQ